MSRLVRRLAVIFLVVVALIPLEAAIVSRRSADEFSMKIALIQRQGDMTERAGTLRTRLTEDELNSWFSSLRTYAVYGLAPDMPHPAATHEHQAWDSGANRRQERAATRDQGVRSWPCVSRAEPVCRGTPRLMPVS